MSSRNAALKEFSRSKRDGVERAEQSAPKALALFRRRLLRWYDANARDLPWRRSPSPYKTVVSEFMLQQTQVKTVLPYYRDFLNRFPSMKALARSSESDVLSSWSGLGYYRRARALHRMARTLVAEHRGRVPADPELLRALPGFGDYTTAAVGSIAHGLPLAAVDGNVRRVLARHFFVAEAPGSPKWKALAAEVLSTERPGDWNQALMELGATVCTPRVPKCGECPVSKSCKGLKQGAIDLLPRPTKRPATVRVSEIAIAAMRRGKVLVLRRGDGQAYAGMWDFPRSFASGGRGAGGRRGASGGDGDGVAAAASPGDVLAEETGLKTKDFKPIGRSRSTFTHHRIETELFLTRGLYSGKVREGGYAERRWVEPDELDELPTGTAQRRLFALLRRHLGRPARSGAGR